MKLEEQVVSLELAKKMKEFGVKQKSCFYWDEGDGIADRLEYSPGTPLLELVSAFTVAELGEMLPASVNDSVINTFKDGSTGNWYFWYSDSKGVAKITVDNAHTEADARAKALIYLIENKLIELPQ